MSSTGRNSLMAEQVLFKTDSQEYDTTCSYDGDFHALYAYFAGLV